jgi:eukaryotic-like serine/threonine-protein kinase
MDESIIFPAALQHTTPEQRAAYLEQACGNNPELRRNVEMLLKAHLKAGNFLAEGPAPQGATIAQPVTEAAGTMIGPYKLLEPIGEGGMGTVWMAQQSEPIKRLVAIKLIKPGMDSKQVLARFEAERQALALMDHPNIAKVFDAGAVGSRQSAVGSEEKQAGLPTAYCLLPTSEGRPYFVMELVKGVPITKYCDEHHLTPRQRLELFIPVCQAIQHAHQKGIIHRDIKPSNVLVAMYDDRPVPKVIDFGVAKAAGQQLTEETLHTNFGAVVGTIEYMSPEQASFNQLDVDTRSDIYSLGVLLYELLAGSPPFTKKELEKVDMLEMLRVIREDEPTKPSTKLRKAEGGRMKVERSRSSRFWSFFRYPFSSFMLHPSSFQELDWIVLKALEKDRSRRYETANSFAMDVQRYLADEPVQACPPSAAYRFRKFARRNKVALAMALVVSLALLFTVGVLAVSTVLVVREQRATEYALHAETSAKYTLDKTLKQERQDAYYRSIALAYRELSADNLGLALKLLAECPEDLHNWEWDLLMRLCRVEQVVLRNGPAVSSLAFSSDGERIATASLDGTLKVWNLRTRQVIWFKEKAHGAIESKVGFASSVTFHPDGTHLASTGQDQLVKVWDLTTDPRQADVFSRPCDTDQIVGTAYAAAFSPLDPNQLAVGSKGVLTIWDWKNKTLVHSYPAHETRRLSVAFSRDGQRLASGDWSGSVKLWNTEATGAPLCTFSETRYAAPSLSFNPDGTRLAAASFDRHVNVWDTTTGVRVHQFPHAGRLALAVAYSPDGRLIVSTGEGKTVHVWEAESGREVLGLRGHTGLCGCVAFSPDGLRLASASMDGTIRIWDATPLQDHERQEISTLPEQSGEIWSLAIHPKDQKIALAGQGNPAKVWDVKTHQVTASSDSLRDIVFCVAWHPDGHRIASAGGNGDQFTVEVWNTLNGQKYSLPFGVEYVATAFSRDGRYLVTGRSNGVVQVWDARDGREIGVLGTHLGVVRGVAFSPEREGRFLASASADGAVKLWDATRLGDVEKTGSQKPIRTFPTHVPGAGLNVAFSPDGKRIAIGDMDYVVKIWELDTGKELATLRGHSGDLYTVAFSLDGRWVASGGEDSTVKVWDSNTGKLLRSFRGHTGLVNSLAFTPDGKRLVTGSRDRKVKFWDVSQLSDTPDGSSK